MESVAAFARGGGAVLGICNGFQVLLEAGLLPGAMQINRGLRYVCDDVHMRVENDATPFTSLYPKGGVVTMPVGHMEGNYTAPPDVLDALEREGRVVFRYCDRDGRVVDSANPNGAARGIAGICNAQGNVVGLMPHPDRCSEGILGNAAGLKMFESAVAWHGRSRDAMRSFRATPGGRDRRPYARIRRGGAGPRPQWTNHP